MPGRYRSDTLEQRISIERLEQAVNIFGSFDENIRLLEQEFSVTVVNRDGELRVEGEAENTMLACKAIQALLTLSSRGEAIGEQNVRYVIGLARSGQEEKIGELRLRQAGSLAELLQPLAFVGHFDRDVHVVPPA